MEYELCQRLQKEYMDDMTLQSVQGNSTRIGAIHIFGLGEQDYEQDIMRFRLLVR